MDARLNRQAAAANDPLSPEILGVELGKRVPFFREIIECEDGRDRANGYARAAVDALHRIDVEQLLCGVLGIIFLGMNAIHRTRIDARSVFGVDARFCDYVSHNEVDLLNCMQLFYYGRFCENAHSSKKSGCWAKAKTASSLGCQPFLVY
jgi:hypothetical protein